MEHWCTECEFHDYGLPGKDFCHKKQPAGIEPKDCSYFKLKPQPEPEQKTEQIRQFSTGATRDTDVGKLNYVKALCPLVLQYYVEYLGKHRVQSDGSLRDWDNWKKGIDKQVYMEGLGRHEHAVWLLNSGYPAFDNHGPVTMKDSLCGVIFNSMGMLREILEEERKDKK